MSMAAGETAPNRATPETGAKACGLPEEVSAYAVKRAYARALTGLQEYRDILGSVGNGADRSYAANDADEFDQVITEIRTMSDNARSEDDENEQI